MYIIFLTIHSWARWLVLLLAIIVIIKALSGWLGKKSFGKADNATAASFVGGMHLQLVLGFILYFVYSPFGYAAFQNRSMGEVMKDSAIRPWAVEHITMMVLAVIFAQVGRSLSKKASESAKKHRLLAIFTIIALLLMLAGIPWAKIPVLFRI